MTYRTNATRMLAGAGAAILLLASGAAGADPHSDGLAFGKGQLGGLNDKVNPQNAQDLPFYTNNPPQAGGFGGHRCSAWGWGGLQPAKRPNMDRIRSPIRNATR
jgi:hypothetical protein